MTFKVTESVARRKCLWLERTFVTLKQNIFHVVPFYFIVIPTVMLYRLRIKIIEMVLCFLNEMFWNFRIDYHLVHTKASAYFQSKA